MAVPITMVPDLFAGTLNVCLLFRDLHSPAGTRGFSGPSALPVKEPAGDAHHGHPGGAKLVSEFRVAAQGQSTDK